MDGGGLTDVSIQWEVKIITEAMNPNMYNECNTKMYKGWLVNFYSQDLFANPIVTPDFMLSHPVMVVMQYTIGTRRYKPAQVHGLHKMPISILV